MRRRVAVLIGGRGSNMTALLAAAARADYPATIALVLSHRAEAAGLAVAAGHGVATLAVPHRGRDRTAHEDAVEAALREHAIELVCLAGWMRLFSAAFVGRWAGRMINIHPSLLPAFPGLDTHARALAAGVKLHGCTVHLVTAGMDEGPILGQAAVPVMAGDDAASLGARVLAQEHRLYPAVLAALAGGSAIGTDRDAALCNPLPLAAEAP